MSAGLADPGNRVRPGRPGTRHKNPGGASGCFRQASQETANVKSSSACQELILANVNPLEIDHDASFLRYSARTFSLLLLDDLRPGIAGPKTTAGLRQSG